MILQRYIGTNLAKGWLLVFCVLGAVFGLIAYVEELGRTGGDYGPLAAARYTLLTLPNQLVSLAPVIALLGSIVALANLDRYNELTIVSCTGFSQGKLLAAIALPTILLMIGLWLCMEYVSPQLQQSAERGRNLQRYHSDIRIPSGGVWSTDGHRYIHLGNMHKDNVPAAISLFEFGEDGQLIRALRARTAQVSPDRRWIFQKVREKRMVNGKLITRGHPELTVDNLWARDELPTLTLASDSMPLSVLYRYIQYQASNGQPTEKDLGVFWQRLLMPLTVFSMVLLATPISANIASGRNRSFGVNMGIGAVVGVLFYLGAQIIFALGQLMNWSLPLVAVLPALLVLLCALILLQRMRW